MAVIGRDLLDLQEAHSSLESTLAVPAELRHPGDYDRKLEQLFAVVGEVLSRNDPTGSNYAPFA